MDENTARLGLPLMNAGQAQKELTHNEALLLIDMLAQCAVASMDVAAPPLSPAPGDCWIVPPASGGAWTGRDGCIAAWTAGGWRFALPRAGMRAWLIDRGHGARHDGAQWLYSLARDDGYYVAGDRVIGARLPAVADPSGGATVDEEARAAISALAQRMRDHGLIA